MSIVTNSPERVEDKKDNVVAPMTFSKAATATVTPTTPAVSPTVTPTKPAVNATVTPAAAVTATDTRPIDWTQINVTESDTFTRPDHAVEQHDLSIEIQHSVRPRRP